MCAPLYLYRSSFYWWHVCTGQHPVAKYTWRRRPPWSSAQSSVFLALAITALVTPIPPSRGVHAQVYRACKDRDRRLLFRAWNRLCLHAASRDATGVQWATGASKAKAATLKAKENEAIAATTAINVPPNNDVIQEQAETAAQRAREQRQKCAVQLVNRFPEISSPLKNS